MTTSVPLAAAYSVASRSVSSGGDGVHDDDGNGTICTNSVSCWKELLRVVTVHNTTHPAQWNGQRRQALEAVAIACFQARPTFILEHLRLEEGPVAAVEVRDRRQRLDPGCAEEVVSALAIRDRWWGRQREPAYAYTQLHSHCEGTVQPLRPTVIHTAICHTYTDQRLRWSLGCTSASDLGSRI